MNIELSAARYGFSEVATSSLSFLSPFLLPYSRFTFFIPSSSLQAEARETQKPNGKVKSSRRKKNLEPHNCDHHKTFKHIAIGSTFIYFDRNCVTENFGRGKIKSQNFYKLDKMRNSEAFILSSIFLYFTSNWLKFSLESYRQMNKFIKMLAEFNDKRILSIAAIKY